MKIFLFLVFVQFYCYAFQLHETGKSKTLTFEESPIGFASIDTLGEKGTTGGFDGDTVQLDDQASFQSFMDARRDDKETKNLPPKVIIVKDTIKGIDQIVAKGVYDLTIIGTGSNAVFDGVGLAITNSKI